MSTNGSQPPLRLPGQQQQQQQPTAHPAQQPASSGVPLIPSSVDELLAASEFPANMNTQAVVQGGVHTGYGLEGLDDLFREDFQPGSASSLAASTTATTMTQPHHGLPGTGFAPSQPPGLTPTPGNIFVPQQPQPTAGQPNIIHHSTPVIPTTPARPMTPMAPTQPATPQPAQPSVAVPRPVSLPVTASNRPSPSTSPSTTAVSTPSQGTPALGPAVATPLVTVPVAPAAPSAAAVPIAQVGSPLYIILNSVPPATARRLTELFTLLQNNAVTSNEFLEQARQLLDPPQFEILDGIRRRHAAPTPTPSAGTAAPASAAMGAIGTPSSATATLSTAPSTVPAVATPGGAVASAAGSAVPSPASSNAAVSDASRRSASPASLQNSPLIHPPASQGAAGVARPGTVAVPTASTTTTAATTIIPSTTTTPFHSVTTPSATGTPSPSTIPGVQRKRTTENASAPASTAAGVATPTENGSSGTLLTKRVKTDSPMTTSTTTGGGSGVATPSLPPAVATPATTTSIATPGGRVATPGGATPSVVSSTPGLPTSAAPTTTTTSASAVSTPSTGFMKVSLPGQKPAGGLATTFVATPTPGGAVGAGASTTPLATPGAPGAAPSGAAGATTGGAGAAGAGGAGPRSTATTGGAAAAAGGAGPGGASGQASSATSGAAGSSSTAGGGGGGSMAVDKKVNFDSVTDVMGYVGVDLNEEIDNIMKDNDSYAKQGYVSDGLDRTRIQDFVNTTVLKGIVERIATSHRLQSVDADVMTYLAMATQERLRGLLEQMIAASKHRGRSIVTAAPPMWDNDHPMYRISISQDVKKQLLAIERVEREEETKRKEHMAERERRLAAGEDLDGDGDGGADGSGGTGGGAGGAGGGGGTGKKRKNREGGPGVTARNMSEEARKRIANQTALEYAGGSGRSYSWMMGAGASASSPASGGATGAAGSIGSSSAGAGLGGGATAGSIGGGSVGGGPVRPGLARGSTMPSGTSLSGSAAGAGSGGLPSSATSSSQSRPQTPSLQSSNTLPLLGSGGPSTPTGAGAPLGSIGGTSSSTLATFSRGTSMILPPSTVGRPAGLGLRDQTRRVNVRDALFCLERDRGGGGGEGSGQRVLMKSYVKWLK
ncbi:hypothetical protein BGZ73_008328 [Actinomortierella ambigua]|nr:hypothetical protein BGZ73_008328 [Actinomortierella ambigua]